MICQTGFKGNRTPSLTEIGAFRFARRHSVAQRPQAASRAAVALAGVLLASALAPAAANAAGTATTTMPVTMTITAGCTVAATAVPFGTQSTLARIIREG